MADRFSSIEKIMSGYNPARQLREQTKKLVKKWSPTGLLDGLKDSTQTHGMAVLLENQARQLIDEASRVSTTSNKEEWSGVALPLVRRIFGEIAAQDFVSVQPMNLPSGLIFYLDFKYGTAQTSLHNVGSDVHGDTSGSNDDASGGLYGAGKFGYSINDRSSTGVTYTSGSVAWKDVDFEPSLSASFGNLRKISFAKSELTRPDVEGVRAFEPVASVATTLSTWYPAYTQVSGTVAAPLSQITMIVSSAGSQNELEGAAMEIKYHRQPTDTSRGDFEAAAGAAVPEADVGIPEIDIQMVSVPIVAKTRKLKAVWTPELAQDLNAYHSVDAEAELTSMLSEYISMEIDLEILDMLMANADAKVERWSARPAHEYDAATGLFAESSANASAYTKGTWFQTLGNKLQSVSNTIHQKTLRGGANFMVVSPETATIIESIPGYASTATGDATNQQWAMGVQKVGLLNNRFTVYKNPYMHENVILMGFRGSNFLETGAVYAPYVPLIMTPLVYDPTNFTPRKGVMTRYAKKIVRPEFYGKVIVADVNYV
jgi:hypothetical protein